MENNWEKGDIVVIKNGWGDEGKEFTVLGPAIYEKQWWVPVISFEGEDPDWHKATSLIKKQ